MTHGELQQFSIYTAYFRNFLPYVRDKFWAIEGTSLLSFAPFLLATFQYLSCVELFDPTPVQFVPIRLVPCSTEFGRFPCCELCCFSTGF